MQTNEKIRWGILGCGKIAHKFALDLQLSKGGRLAACASRDIQKAKEFAREYNISNYYGDYDSMLQSNEIDVVYIATPHNLHMDHAIRCARYKKHVLCEKPVAVNKKQVVPMIQEAKNADVFLMEAMWTAFLPAIVLLKNELQHGIIGDIRHVKADFGFKANYDPNGRLFNPNLAGGSLLDIGIYPVFIALSLFGRPSEIFAGAKKSLTGVDEECTIMLVFPGGITASLYSSVTCDTDTTCEIIGTEGKIIIPSRFHEQDKFTVFKKGEENKTIVAETMGKGYFHEIEHVHGCLGKGLTESPVMTHELSILLIETMDRVRQIIDVHYPFE